MDDSLSALAVASNGQDPMWEHLRDALRDLQFGSVTLIVQDGVVVQIDRLEKQRLTRLRT